MPQINCENSAARSAPNEDTKRAVALAHSRECTEELIYIRSAKIRLDGNVRSYTEKRNILRNKKAADVLPLSLLSRRLPWESHFGGGGVQDR